MSEHASETEQLMEAFTEVTNERDYERLPEVVSESFVWSTPAAPENQVQGFEEARAVIEKITSGFSDFRAEVAESTASGDTGMAELRFTMTHDGEYEGIPPTGREVELRGMSKWRVADGRIQELTDTANMQALLEQLGVTDE